MPGEINKKYETMASMREPWLGVQFTLNGTSYSLTSSTEGSAGNLHPCLPLLVSVSSEKLTFAVTGGSIYLVTALKVG